MAASAPDETPVPDNAMTSDGFAPFEVMVTDPFAFPVVCGANATVNVVL